MRGFVKGVFDFNERNDHPEKLLLEITPYPVLLICKAAVNLCTEYLIRFMVNFHERSLRIMLYRTE